VAEEHKRNPNTNCSICTKPLYKRPGLLEVSKGKAYCSQACYGKSCRREIPCLVCSKLILGGLNKKTCSRSCSNTYRTGIKYKLGRPKDKAKTAYLLKLRLLEIRDRKCERCEYNKIEILQVHHKDRDRNNNELNNLELMCPNCHYEEHYSGGKLESLEKV
jgi:hypothetical protein